MRRLPARAALALALAAGVSAVHAQDQSAAGSTTDMGAMPGMDMPDDAHDAAHGSSMHHAMPMQHPHDPSMPPTHTRAMPQHAMGPMQGGAPPADARDPDYSDGIPSAPMRGIDMGMEDGARRVSLRIDQLEAFHDHAGSGRQWDAAGGYGNNRDRIWLRTEGEHRRGEPVEADVEALWQHAVAAFWDTRLGVRTDTGEGPQRQWLALGLQGLAPYGFELEATGYVGPASRTAARLRVDYELLLTQRLVLQPELKLDAYGKADPARGLGSGLSDAALGLRLRYEVRREVAPYVGWEWTRRFGGTAAHGRTDAEGPLDRRWVAGVRIRL
jgi:copper resistance protein B